MGQFFLMLFFVFDRVLFAFIGEELIEIILNQRSRIFLFQKWRILDIKFCRIKRGFERAN